MDNEVTHYQMAIVPTNKSGVGDPKCELVVYASIVVIREPIDANSANDMEALARAHDQVAQRLGVPVENIEY